MQKDIEKWLDKIDNNLFFLGVELDKQDEECALEQLSKFEGYACFTGDGDGHALIVHNALARLEEKELVKHGGQIGGADEKWVLTDEGRKLRLSS